MMFRGKLYNVVTIYNVGMSSNQPVLYTPLQDLLHIIDTVERVFIYQIKLI